MSTRIKYPYPYPYPSYYSSENIKYLDELDKKMDYYDDKRCEIECEYHSAFLKIENKRMRRMEELNQLMKEAEEESFAEFSSLEEKSGITTMKLEKRLLRNAKTDYELNIEMEYTLSLHQPK
jgi:hypothetical protein